MGAKISWMTLLPFLFLLLAVGCFAREYVIYNITQEVAQEEKKGGPNKNFFINMGTDQGLKKGTVVDVFRVLSHLDPYNNNSRYSYRVKIGQLEVIHSEAQSSITRARAWEKDLVRPVLEINDFMVGDPISVHVAD